MNPGHRTGDNMEPNPTRRLNYAAPMHGTDRRSGPGQPGPQTDQDQQSQAWMPPTRKKNRTDKHSAIPPEAGRSKPPDGQPNTPARSWPSQGRGVKKVSVRIGLGRDGPDPQPLTEWRPPLEMSRK